MQNQGLNSTSGCHQHWRLLSLCSTRLGSELPAQRSRKGNSWSEEHSVQPGFWLCRLRWESSRSGGSFAALPSTVVGGGFLFLGRDSRPRAVLHKHLCKRKT